jgi:hypothetical protein
MEEEKLRKSGELLAERSKYMTFRSGNADGADQLLRKALEKLIKTRIELFTPHATHQARH